MGNSVALEERWDDYYDPGFRPTSWTDRTRVALLRGDAVDPSAQPKGKRDHVSGIASGLRRLGYDVTVSGGVYQVTNPDHRPSANDFANDRARYRPSAGSREVATRTNGKRARGIAVVAEMLPPLATELVVTAAGLDLEGGSPFLILTSAEGWRYSVTVGHAEPPRGA